MHELRIERSLNTHGLFDLMRCNIRSVNCTLRTARALNDPYQSDELKLFSTDRKGLQRSVRIERTEFAFNGSLQCGCIGHEWRPITSLTLLIPSLALTPSIYLFFLLKSPQNRIPLEEEKKTAQYYNIFVLL